MYFANDNLPIGTTILMRWWWAQYSEDFLNLTARKLTVSIAQYPALQSAYCIVTNRSKAFVWFMYLKRLIYLVEIASIFTDNCHRFNWLWMNKPQLIHSIAFRECRINRNKGLFKSLFGSVSLFVLMAFSMYDSMQSHCIE